jgi:voltage-gated potassium channel
MRSFFALVDLVAVLPAILGFFDAADFRVLRLLRLLRMLKLVRHSTTFGLLFAVLREESRSIVALLFVLLLTVVISGSLMYMLESAAQPESFPPYRRRCGGRSKLSRRWATATWCR